MTAKKYLDALADENGPAPSNPPIAAFSGKEAADFAAMLMDDSVPAADMFAAMKTAGRRGRPAARNGRKAYRNGSASPNHGAPTSTTPPSVTASPTKATTSAHWSWPTPKHTTKSGDSNWPNPSRQKECHLNQAALCAVGDILRAARSHLACDEGEIRGRHKDVALGRDR